MSSFCYVAGTSPRTGARVQHIDLGRPRAALSLQYQQQQQQKGVDGKTGTRVYRPPYRVELPFSPPTCPSTISVGGSHTPRSALSLSLSLSPPLYLFSPYSLIPHPPAAVCLCLFVISHTTMNTSSVSQRSS